MTDLVYVGLLLSEAEVGEALVFDLFEQVSIEQLINNYMLPRRCRLVAVVKTFSAF